VIQEDLLDLWAIADLAALADKLEILEILGSVGSQELQAQAV
jgi:hypothetical protein